MTLHDIRSQAGHLGGLATLRRHGIEHFRAAGLVTLERHGIQHYERMGQLGGRPSVQSVTAQSSQNEEKGGSRNLTAGANQPAKGLRELKMLWRQRYANSFGKEG